MTEWQGKRSISGPVSSCLYDLKRTATTFVLNEVEVTYDEALNGVHYYLAEAELLTGGYEEPFVHFDEFESPAVSASRRPPATEQPRPFGGTLMSRIIEVIVSPTGETSIQTKGYSGGDCLQASKFLE